MKETILKSIKTLLWMRLYMPNPERYNREIRKQIRLIRTMNFTRTCITRTITRKMVA